MSVPLTKVDSAIAGLSLEEIHEKPPASEGVKDSKKQKPSKRGSISSDKRSSISSEKRGSAAEGVYNINELGKYISMAFRGSATGQALLCVVVPAY